MNKLWQKTKEHPIASNVVATVIGTLIAAGFLAIVNQVFSLNIFSSIICFAGQKYIVPMWGLVVIGISPIVLIIGIRFFSRNAKALTNNQPDWKYYVEDVIFGVLWQWKYIYDLIDIRIESIIALCPKCKRRLDSISDITSPFSIPFYMKCPNCEFRTGDFNKERVLLTRDAIREIEGRIRSGEYKEKIKANPH